jgi:hypothetical protein
LCAFAALHGRLAFGLAAAVRMLAVIAASLAVSRMLCMGGVIGVLRSRCRLRLVLGMTLVCLRLSRGLGGDWASERERGRCNEHRFHVISPDEMA